MGLHRSRLCAVGKKTKLSALLLAILTLSGCFRSPHTDQDPYSSPPTFTPIGRWGMQPFPPYDSITPESGPCITKKKEVIATCVKLTENTVSLGDLHIIVGERTTGNLIEFNNRKRISIVAHIPVSTRNEGGLLDFVLSPEFNSNGIAYALITTDNDIELVRKAPHDIAKPIIRGIPLIENPKGVLKFIGKKLYVAISSLTNFNENGVLGTIFSVDNLSTDGTSQPRVFVHNIAGRVGFCPTVNNSEIYIITHSIYRDSLYRVKLDGTNLKSLWTWNTAPGITDCLATTDSIFITENETSRLEKLPLSNNGIISQQPIKLIDGKYGHLNRLSTAVIKLHQVLLVGTVNKFSNSAIISDDRVIIVPITGGTGESGGPSSKA